MLACATAVSVSSVPASASPPGGPPSPAPVARWSATTGSVITASIPGGNAMKHQRRSGFTLFQLLIVLALLLILLALLLPALAQARLAAARMQSQNNLRHIG